MKNARVKGTVTTGAILGRVAESGTKYMILYGSLYDFPYLAYTEPAQSAERYIS